MKKIHTILIALIFVFCTSTGNPQDLILSYTINPIESLSDLADIKIIPSSGTASSAQSGEGIEKAFDGDMNTIYHSSWSATTFPVTLQFLFPVDTDIDYMIYHPRTSGGNGLFKEIEVWYKLKEGSETKYNDYDFGGSSSSSTVRFDATLINVEYIKIIVNSGAGDGNGFASCAEMEFYKKNVTNLNLTDFFVDEIYSNVKSGITKDDILNSDLPIFFKHLALEQLSGNYSPFRIRSHEAYRPYNDLAKELKTSTYNQYENPTGIYVESGQNLVIFVSACFQFFS